MFQHFRMVAVNLERELHYTQYSTRPISMGFIRGDFVLNRALFFLPTLPWAYAVFAVPLGWGEFGQALLRRSTRRTP